MATLGRAFSFEKFFEGIQIPIGKIYQIGEISIVKGSEILHHKQICDEITYVVSGEALFYSNDECHLIKAGQIHFIKEGSMHRIEAGNNENFRYVCLGVSLNQNYKFARDLYEKMDTLNHFIINDNGLVKHLSEYLIREIYNWDENSIDMINFYLSQILITITRIFCDNVYQHLKDTKEKSSHYVMYKLLRFIDREYISLTSVKEIAERLSYSESYLQHLFKERMGITIKEYLIKKKINFASELLITKSLSVEQITEQLNFSSSHVFRRLFKQYTSYSPSEYKKINK